MDAPLLPLLPLLRRHPLLLPQPLLLRPLHLLLGGGCWSLRPLLLLVVAAGWLLLRPLHLLLGGWLLRPLLLVFILASFPFVVHHSFVGFRLCLNAGFWPSSLFLPPITELRVAGGSEVCKIAMVWHGHQHVRAHFFQSMGTVLPCTSSAAHERRATIPVELIYVSIGYHQAPYCKMLNTCMPILRATQNVQRCKAR